MKGPLKMIEMSEEDYKELRNRIVVLEKENNRLVGLNKSLTTSCAAATQEVDKVKADREVARREADYLRKRCQEAEDRADATAASLVKAKDEVAWLVRLNDDFKDQLVAFKREAAAVTDQLRLSQAEYDARGKVIKKLRKRLHKLKKKLEH